ncbi:hypothetical protein AB6A40_011046 [Gnathostoma spinigerum]|uniref:C2H2-type domain-containing protein n=1 Tax=Gnathostoma spinigerum TaxID=75299 RepID=A0ABD6F3U6_9BILA
MNQKNLSGSSASSSSSGYASNGYGRHSSTSGSSSLSGSSLTNANSTPFSAYVPSASSRKYICTYCQKAMSSPRNLQRHHLSCKAATSASNVTSAEQVHDTNSTHLNFGNQYSVSNTGLNSTSMSSPSITPSMHSSTAECAKNMSIDSIGRKITSSSSNHCGVSDFTTLSTDRQNSDRRCEEFPEGQPLLPDPSCSSSSYNLDFPQSDDRLGPECEDSFLDSAVAEMAQHSDLNMLTAGSLASSILDDDDNSLPPMRFSDDGFDLDSVPSVPAPNTQVENNVCPNTPVAQMPPAALFQCESCSKTVSSSRSLKRHRGTCKQYQLDYGLSNKVDTGRSMSARCGSTSTRLSSAF